MCTYECVWDGHDDWESRHPPPQAPNCTFWKEAQSKGPDMVLILGYFQGTGKSLKMRNNLEEQLT